MRIRRVHLLSLSLLALPLFAFTPFTEVNDVCPDCPRPTQDVVVLKSGQKVWCNVVGENDDYWILERHSELRAAFKSEVSAVKWGSGRSAGDLKPADQILLKNDILYHGKILSEQPGDFFVIEMRHKQKPSVALVRSVHKNGKAYAFAPPRPPAPKAVPKAAPPAPAPRKAKAKKPAAPKNDGAAEPTADTPPKTDAKGKKAKAKKPKKPPKEPAE